MADNNINTKNKTSTLAILLSERFLVGEVADKMRQVVSAPQYIRNYSFPFCSLKLLVP